MNCAFFFTDHAAVIVSLKNIPLVSQRSCMGTYISSSEVNGRPSFKSSGKAIWYSKDLNAWIIGRIQELGNNTGCFYTKNRFFGLANELKGLASKKNRWLYWNSGWKVARQNEINLQFIQISK